MVNSNKDSGKFVARPARENGRPGVGAQVIKDGETVELVKPKVETAASESETPTAPVKAEATLATDVHEEPAVTKPTEPSVADDEPKTDDPNIDNGPLGSLFGGVRTTESDEAAARKIAKKTKKLYRKAKPYATYTDNGVIQAPGYWQGWPGRFGRVNVFAWLGIITVFMFFPLGMLFSGIGWVNARAVPDDKFSKILSAAGFIAAAVVAFCLLVILIIRLLELIFVGFMSHLTW